MSNDSQPVFPFEPDTFSLRSSTESSESDSKEHVNMSQIVGLLPGFPPLDSESPPLPHF